MSSRRLGLLILSVFVLEGDISRCVLYRSQFLARTGTMVVGGLIAPTHFYFFCPRTTIFPPPPCTNAL